MTARTPDGGRTGLSWALSLGVVAALTLGVFHVLGRPIPWREVAAGWGLALANGVAAGCIHRVAIRHRDVHTPLWGLAMGSLRAGLVFAIVLLVWRMAGARAFQDFLLGFFPGYLVFFVREMASLYRRGGTGESNEVAATDEH